MRLAEISVNSYAPHSVGSSLPVGSATSLRAGAMPTLEMHSAKVDQFFDVVKSFSDTIGPDPNTPALVGGSIVALGTIRYAVDRAAGLKSEDTVEIWIAGASIAIVVVMALKRFGMPTPPAIPVNEILSIAETALANVRDGRRKSAVPACGTARYPIAPKPLC
jgi:hypothetical protein